MTPPTLRIADLAFTYPDGRRALDGVDLEVGVGERIALLGPNGAGKTTLALHLNGIHAVQEGVVEVSGMPVVPANLGEIRRRVGMVFQDTDDQLFMPRVADDVAFGPANLGLRGPDLELRVKEALDAVGAADLASRAPHHLSGGERRRVALATVLAMRPDVLVLDEPTSGLDPAGRRELAEVLAGLAITQVLITHDLPFALELCDRAAIVNAGRVVADGRVVDVLSDEAVLAANRLELPLGFDPRLGFERRRR
ncbi:energy-coupling factor ABC transporter ATP-binding protein [Euzebya sp.]|uniref:energy-coupling factor ABC transporter ATP-binding protein n=1 Tax=Euzebya sp. TaxID=1971409 RepID=UPI00351129A2